MNRVHCAQCGVEHELGDLEPSYQLPDAIHTIAEGDRPNHAKIARNLCALWGSHDDEHRWFVRSLVPFEVHGRLETCSWGIWVEVTRPAFDEIVRLWDEPNQLVHGPWRGTIANDAATYASTTGLRGTLRFVDVTSIPHFAPDPELEHPFVQEWRTGVSIKRMTDWQLAFSHSA